TILDSAVHLCRAEGGSFRLSEEIGFRLVAYKVSPAFSELVSPPMLRGQDSLLGRLFGSKSPVHIPDLATHLERNSVGEADRAAIARGVGPSLMVPMPKNDELMGPLGLGGSRIDPFTEKETDLVTHFAAQAPIALDTTRRERELRELQIELARVNRIATMEQ